MKNAIIKKHFLNPKNMGHIENPSYKSISKSGKCSDIVKMTAVIKEGFFIDIKTEVFGCGYSIAGASLVTEIVKGNRAEGILDKIKNELASVLGDVPEKHHSCITLSMEAFGRIFDQYKSEDEHGPSGNN